MDELKLNELIEEGLSTRAIAARFGVSQSTVKHYLKKYGLKTKATIRLSGNGKEVTTDRMGRPYSKEEISDAVNKSKTISDVFRNLGLKINGGAYKWIRGLIAKYDLSTDHFMSHQERMFAMSKKSALISQKEVYKTDDLSNGERISSQKLRNFMIFKGIEEKCKNCNLTHWLGNLLRLDIDHINENPCDNRLENLQFLCPNCHRLKTIPINKEVIKKPFGEKIIKVKTLKVKSD